MKYRVRPAVVDRSRTEIVAMILEAANGGATKTKIRDQVFLSHSDLKEYLALLVENDLLDYEGENQIYRITEKGMHLLWICNKMDQLASINNV